VHEAFGIVLFAVVVVGAIVAVLSLVGRRRLYDQIGRGALSLDREAPGPAPAGSPAAALERDDEIRQLLTARNDRRRARGETEIDVDAEVARLTAPAADPGVAAPAADPGLATEVRQLVQARNERRLRAGKPALDVEEEVARQLRDLGA
jgi:hypothetical protein